jgi:cellulose synthase/poly-beta-1,6-N-acetylglucosamine synthase-like glycosyltransferase
MREEHDVIERVRATLREQGIGIAVVVPSYGEGRGIVSTLTSLHDGLVRLGVPDAALFLSDSSPNSATVDAAQQWAVTAGCQLTVDHSDQRRSLKQALNVALDWCDTDVVAVTVADVIVPATSLAHVIAPICVQRSADAAVGVAAPDLSVHGLRYQAGSSQMRAVRRLVYSGDMSIRAEGALWAAHRRFYAQWRFPIGQGSVADDVELARAVQARGFRGVTVPDATVLKIPPGTVRDFCLQTRRFYFATSEDRRTIRSRSEWRAFAGEALRDSAGALLYCSYRAAAAMTARHWASMAHTETWEPSMSTKRGSSA